MSATAQQTSALVPEPKASKGLMGIGIVLLIAGAALSLPALFNQADRPRFAFAYLWGFTSIWTVMLGCLFFVGLHHLTHAVWSVVVRRIAEMFAAPMWILAILFVPILGFAIFHEQFQLFPWMDADLMEHDHLLHGKKPYLNFPFFVIRAIVFFALWIGFTKFFVGTSLRQDAGEGGEPATARMRKFSAIFMLIFAGTITFAGIDWLMSLEPRWFSTIFGVYIFSGMVVSSLAAITIVTVWLRRSGRLGDGIIHPHHLYNLGVLMFAFVCFWAYIAFSQYMLIWYANMPEESFYLADRLKGGWLGVSVALALVRFAVPFLALLSQRAKMNPTMLVWVSILVLAGQMLDMYWLIMPQLHTEGPQLGWQEIGPPLLLIGVIVLFMSQFIKKHSPLATGDPLFDESKRFRL